MRKFIKKIIEILDGTPAEYGRKRQVGQSLIEMAFISPLLIILVAGVVEIGWLANNYLVLQEVTRVGARRGTVLVGDNSPISWNNRASLIPKTIWKTTAPGSYTPLSPAADEPERIRFRDCNSPNEQDFGFYNLIVCIMLRSLDPLPFREGLDPTVTDPLIPEEMRFYPDDIVVSAFALLAVNNPVDVNFTAYGVTGKPLGNYVYVVGRYPYNANECTVAPDGSPVQVERDPFDYITDNQVTCEISTCGLAIPAFLELATYDESLGVIISGFDSNVDEFQRGFSWNGQHRVQLDEWNTVEVDCFGSQWTIERVERLVNLPNFNLNNEQREHLPPGQGLVLVEIFWRHTMMLDLPFFTPVYNMFDKNQTTITAWSAFPAPGAEPRVDFTP